MTIFPSDLLWESCDGWHGMKGYRLRNVNANVSEGYWSNLSAEDGREGVSQDRALWLPSPSLNDLLQHVSYNGTCCQNKLTKDAQIIELVLKGVRASILLLNSAGKWGCVRGLWVRVCAILWFRRLARLIYRHFRRRRVDGAGTDVYPNLLLLLQQALSLNSWFGGSVKGWGLSMDVASFI